ncbi:MAG: putative amidophosphoribosyltransferase [Myxococcales bacterium]|nr:putative amidophosphoribosyltransferase [Myxococcales bacterium]
MFEKLNRTPGLGVRLMQAALALIYPARCIACDQIVDDDLIFCAPCAATLVPNDSACPRCALPSPIVLERPPPCVGCLTRPHRFRGALAAYEFGGALAEAIRRMKWAHMPELAPQLGLLLDEALAQAPPEYADVDVIVPVPLHKRRLRLREFNQAAELAAAMREAARAREATIARVPIELRALRRLRDTPPQTGLDAAARRRNVFDAFVVRDASRIHGRRVLLVDDVLTTGATADACASALERAGAAEVLVLTLGRAVT